MDYNVYVLESLSDGKWYYGFSEDMEQRFLDHQSNRSKYTRFKGPWKLIFKKRFVLKTEALQFEKYLKKTKNKVFIRKTFAEFFID
ncbi:MAG: GIY-YIG nuclease family protein [Cyclobacteriaceae bacterium]|nr:GIY-YIG nuclease family protein [Cyclobacteriaceae bacterium]MBX2958021.1 GIY-YIG nuclease family protein [Cyclobacteriaceae bacterium]